MNDQMKSFLQEGVRSYSEARQTLATFEGEMQRLLAIAVRDRARWSPMKNHRISPPFVGGGRGDYGWWVAVAITGRSPRREDAEIDCGLWWNVPEMREPIIYASFYRKPTRVVNFKWDSGKQGIASFPHVGRTFLYAPVPETLDIGKPLNRLLDALLKQLG
jgi:hypothetical protein